MTVNELIEKLKEFDGELEARFYDRYNSFGVKISSVEQGNHNHFFPFVDKREDDDATDDEYILIGYDDE